jgi:hypothetical protein
MDSNRHKISGNFVSRDLILIVFAALATLTATHYLAVDDLAVEPREPNSSSVVNWADVNLASGQVTSPEEEVQMARSKMFQDFEAR